MQYRSMLVFLDNGVACLARIRLAIHLAKQQDCRLIGLAPTGLIGIPPETEAATPLADYATLAWGQLRDQAEWAAQRFRDECDAAGFPSWEAWVDEADQARSVVSHAHCSDLALLSQARPDAPGVPPACDLVDDVVLKNPRPTLVVPHAWQDGQAGTKILAAWDDSREAARALSDALPLLRRADRVELVLWRESAEEDDDALHRRLDEVHRWLSWHGVTSHGYIESARQGTATAIHARAMQMDADLIVMGAYGHARWIERALGGATRGTLASMTVPVLMSH